MKDKFIQPISKEIFFRKYALHGEKTEDEVFDLMSQEVASVEPDEQRRIQWKNVFLGVLSQRKFIPAGRILANARPDSPMKNYQNCYVIPIGDSMEEIYQAVNDDALIGKMGGGVGFNISKLRPKGAPISKGGESSGPMSFLEVFDTSAKAIHTGGGRRGAHIVIMNCDHPDIEEFVTYKQGERNNRLTQFNISVGVTDKFMRAVERDAGWDLVFEGKKYKTLRARDLYNLIMENMFQHNEPGIFFLDEVQRNNSAISLYDINSVNPCGEQPLPDYGCCCLGALNLTEFIKEPFTDSASFDLEGYRETTKIAVRFLDNVLSASEYPLEKIKEHVLNERRIGLGFTGLGDALAMLRIPYGSDESKDFSKLAGSNLRDYSYLASTELAKEKGTFPLYNPEMLNDGFYKTLPAYVKKEMEEHGMRNIALNTVAPTGTTSFSLGRNCSSGIEPIFSLEYNRTIRQEDNSDATERVYDYAWLMYKDFLGQEPEEVPEFFSTTSDVSPYDAIEIQGIFQKYIDASISKTVNLPEGYTFDEFKDLFMFAWKNKLKGFTSFNPNGTMKGILSNDEPEEVETESSCYTHAPKRPRELPCDMYEMMVNKKRVVALVGLYEDRPYEVFLTDDPDQMISLRGAKQGVIERVKKNTYQLNIYGKRSKYSLVITSELFDPEWLALGRMVSMALRHNISLQFIVKQLNKTVQFGTFSKGMARVLKKYFTETETGEFCPECGGELKYHDGCKVCPNCGWSECS